MSRFAAVRAFLADDEGLSLIEYVAGGALVGGFVLLVVQQLFNAAQGRGAFAQSRYAGCVPDSATWTANCP